MTERCNDDVAFLWWKCDYDEDDDCDYHGDGDNSYWDRDHKDDEKEKNCSTLFPTKLRNGSGSLLFRLCTSDFHFAYFVVL